MSLDLKETQKTISDAIDNHFKQLFKENSKPNFLIPYQTLSDIISGAVATEVIIFYDEFDRAKKENDIVKYENLRKKGEFHTQKVMRALESYEEKKNA